MPSTLKQLSYELGIVIWIINIKNLLGWQLECCVQVSCLVLSPVLIFFTNGNKKISVLLSDGAFHTCPSSSWWLPCSETHIKAILWVGWPGRISLPLLLCSSDSPPSFLPPGLRVWPFWRRASSSDSLSGQRHGCLPFLPCSQPCCAGFRGGGSGGRDPGEAGPGGRTPRGVAVSIVPAALSVHHPAAVGHLPNEAGL